MEITQVKIFPVQEDKLKAFVSVVFDHCFMVNDIKVIQGKDGLFLSMPSRRKKSGEFKDVAHPLNNETRRMLEEKVLREYRREVDDATPRRPDRDAAEREEADGGAADRGAADRAAADRAAADGDAGLGSVTSLEGRRPRVRPPEGQRPGVAAVAAAPMSAREDKTLEEVQERHLSDSFWSVS